MERLIKDASQMTDVQQKLGVQVDKTDLSFANIVNAISVMQNSMDISGYSTEQLKDKLANMSLTEEELTKVAEDMGISYEEATNRMKEGTLTVKDASALLGTTAREAETTVSGSLNMVKASWENLLVGMADKNADMGKLINELVESASTFAENLLPVVEQALLGVGTLIETLLPVIIDRLPTIINEVLPKLVESGVKIVTSLIEGIQQNLPTIVQGALQIIQTLIMGIIPLLPQIIEMGIQIIIELAKGLADMLPTLIPVMVEAILTIVNALIDNIDQLVDAGIELILALADGLIEALPRLIEKAPEIIEKLVNALIRNFPKIVKAGGELIGKLAMGIIASLAKLIEVAPKLISTIVDGLKRGWEQIKNIGKYLVEGLWDGISGMANWVKEKVTGFADRIVENMKSALGISSPSKVFRDEVGHWIPEGIAIGIKADTESALQAIDYMSNELVDRMDNAVNFEMGKFGNSGITGSVNEILNTNSKLVVENNNTLLLDGEKIYENQQIIQKEKNLQYAFGGAS